MVMNGDEWWWKGISILFTSGNLLHSYGIDGPLMIDDALMNDGDCIMVMWNYHGIFKEQKRVVFFFVVTMGEYRCLPYQQQMRCFFFWCPGQANDMGSGQVIGTPSCVETMNFTWRLQWENCRTREKTDGVSVFGELLNSCLTVV